VHIIEALLPRFTLKSGSPESRITMKASYHRPGYAFPFGSLGPFVRALSIVELFFIFKWSFVVDLDLDIQPDCLAAPAL
jgi:hypothetical protein